MKPLFKWPGGKARELAQLRPLVPPHTRFLEPFVGGGALFFDLEPEQAVIADTSPQLMDFYRLVGTSPRELRTALDRYEAGRAQMRELASSVAHELVALHERWRGDSTGTEAEVRVLLERSRAPFVDVCPFPFDGEQLWRLSVAAVLDKLMRIRRSEAKLGENWQRADVDIQVRTALQAAFYTLVRDHHQPIDDADASAMFFFIREFAYGGMFRHSRKGNFNVPYGGASYDAKDFAAKVQRVTSPAVAALLARTDVRTQDFEQFFATTTLRRGDFIFFDPPYDTRFSAYDQFAFGEDEHERLAAIFTGLSCAGLLVIQKTPLIERLYTEAQARDERLIVEEYSKKYAFNIRGRHERGVTHLAIRNYQI